MSNFVKLKEMVLDKNIKILLLFMVSMFKMQQSQEMFESIFGSVGGAISANFEAVIMKQ
jgi:hypothetical protein